MSTETQLDAIAAKATAQAAIIRSYEAQVRQHEVSYRRLLEAFQGQIWEAEKVIRQRNWEAEVANARIAELEAALAELRPAASDDDLEDDA